MPTLIRLVVWIAVLAGIAYGSMLALVMLVHNEPTEIFVSTICGSSEAVMGADWLRRMDAFLEMLSAERNAAANTLAAYRRDLEDFAAFASARDRSPETAGQEDIAAFMANLAARSIAASSSARKLSALRQFFRFLVEEGVRDSDPTSGLDSPKQRAPLPKTLSETDVDRILGAAAQEVKASDPDTPACRRALRMHCLVELLYATGLRVSELISLPASWSITFWTTTGACLRIAAPVFELGVLPASPRGRPSAT